MKKTVLIVLIGCWVISESHGQDTDTWDNLFWYGNKIGWGNAAGSWRYSGEIQFRTNNNLQNLDNWYLEGVASYLASKKWEIVPDFRFSVYGDRTEYRPGFGVFYKMYPGEKIQLVHQIKGQLDITSQGTVDQGYRYAFFLNYVIKQRIVPNFLGGIFWSINEERQDGLQFVRTGAGVGWVVDGTHFVNLVYFVGVDFFGDPDAWIGGLFLQLVINLKRDYRYLPGKIINF